MVKNQLREVEKNLRWIAKRNKNISFSIGLVLLYVMLGMNAFAQEVNATVATKQEIGLSTDRLSEMLRRIKEKNNKKLKGTQLELVQLMEQGDQVVKSPWASWQFGMNYFYNNGTKYKGRGDRSEKYSYEGIFTRSTDVFERNTSLDSVNYSKLTTSSDFRSGTTSLRKGILNQYGLVSERKVKEPIASFDVTASINPRNIEKGKIEISEKTIKEPVVPGAVSFEIPSINVVSPTAPEIQSNIAVINIATVPEKTVTPPILPGTVTFNKPEVKIEKSEKPEIEVRIPDIKVAQVSEKTANTPVLPKTISFNPIAPEIELPKEPSLPEPPTFAVVLGADCNSNCNSNSRVRQKPKNDFELNNRAQGNTLAILHYTWEDNRVPIESAKGLAFKMYAESSSNSFVLGSSNPLVGSLDPNQKEYYFNSYNFGDEYNYIYTSFGVVNKNNQKFFVGGSRFIENDNGSGMISIPEGYELNLGGILTLGLVSQGHATTQRNDGIITDKKEKDDKFIKELKYDENKDYLTIHGPTEDYQIKRSQDGYVGYKVGIALVQEDNITGGEILNNYAGTIDFRGERSIGLYTYLPSLRTNRKMTNHGEISLSGKESYGMKYAATEQNNGEVTFTNEEQGEINLRKNPDGEDKADNSAAMALMKDATIVNGVTLRKGQAKNKGTISLTGVENSLGMFVNIESDMTNEGKISINSNITENAGNSQPVNVAMRADNKNAEVINENKGTITIDGAYAIGMLANKGAKATNKGKIETTNSISHGTGLMAIDNSSLSNSGSVSLKGTDNIGVYLNKSTGTFENGSAITVDGNKSTGVLVANSTLTYAGSTKISGNNVVGIVVDKTSNVTGANAGTIEVGSLATPAGEITENGKTKGSYGIIVQQGGTFNQSNTDLTAYVKGSNSAGIYSQGTTTLGKVNTYTSEGAINFFADNGTIKIEKEGGVSETGQKSLLFYTKGDNAKILINKDMTATIKGGDDPSNRGTAFYYEGTDSGYTQFNDTNIAAWRDKIFKNGINTLSNLTLKMEKGSRLFIASKVEMDLRNTSSTTIGSALGLKALNGTNYKTFMLYNSKLTVNQNVDLDSTTDPYNALEISNSSMENYGEMSGRDDNKTAMAQENVLPNKNAVTLVNIDKITLSGKSSTGIYAKYGIIENKGTIAIKGDKSTGIYALDNTEVANKATINVEGDKSTGIFYSDKKGTEIFETKTNLENVGTIKLKSTDSVGIYYQPGNIANNTVTFENKAQIESEKESNIGMYAKVSEDKKSYTTINSGNIFLKDGTDNNLSVAMYTNATEKDTNPLENVDTGSIKIGNKAIGMYGFDEINSGNITIADGSIAMYSQGGKVETKENSIIVVGKNNSVGIYLKGTAGEIASEGKYEVGQNSFGIVDRGTGNQINLTDKGLAILNGNTKFIYSEDTTGKITNKIKIVSKAPEGKNYGIYSKGEVENSGNIEFLKGNGNVGILAKDQNSNITNKGTIKIGKASSKTERNIGIISDSGRAKNEGIVNADGNYGIGLYAKNTGTVENAAAGTVTVQGDETIAAYASDNANINLTGGEINAAGKKVVGYYLDKGTNSTISAGAKINVNGENSNGIFVNQGTLTHNGEAKVTGDGVYGLVVNAGGTLKSTSGKLTVEGMTASTPSNQSDDRGMVALVVEKGGKITDKGLDVTANIKGEKSVGIYSAGNAEIGAANVTTSNGAVNFFANSGTISINKASTVETGTGDDKGSLLFYAPTATSKILIKDTMTATVKGEPNVSKTGTAFFYEGTDSTTYTPFTTANITSWKNERFENTLSNLKLNMKANSRLFTASKVAMNLSDTNASGLQAALGIGELTGAGYRTFMLYNSKLTVNQNIDLDSTTDPYNVLEISNSSIVNETGRKISGAQPNKVAIAQENNLDDKNAVTLENKGTIELEGTNSTGIFAKNGIIKNELNASIKTTGDKSTAIYGLNNTEISNKGEIAVGKNSTGIFYSDKKGTDIFETKTSLKNEGKITLTSIDGVGMYYQPGKIETNTVEFKNEGTITSTGSSNVGMYAGMSKDKKAYNTINARTISLGNGEANDPAVGMYTNADEKGINPLKNEGTITVGNKALGMYGYGEITTGNITVGDSSTAMYSQGGKVEVGKSSTLTVGKKDAVGIFVNGTSGEVVSAGNYKVEDESYGVIVKGNSNTVKLTGGTAILSKYTKFIYSEDTTGTVTTATNITATGNDNYGIYTSGKAVNKGNITMNTGIGNVGLLAKTATGEVTNEGTIKVGASTDIDHSIGMVANRGKALNIRNIEVNGADGLGLYAKDRGTVENSGTITTNGDLTVGAYAADTSNINLTAGTMTINGDKATGYYLDKGQNSTIKSNAKVIVKGDNSNGIFVNQGKLSYNGETTVTGNGVYGLVAGNGATVTSLTGKLNVAGISGASNQSNDRGTVALVVQNGGTVTGEGLDVKANITGAKSVGIYSAGKAEIGAANITTSNGVVNFFANNGTISINKASTVETGTGAERGSLLFYAPTDTSKIHINANMTATVKGNADPTKTGTAFFYEASGSEYSPFNTDNITAWKTARFGNTLNKLTLNMDTNSRLFTASKVAMNLSDTSSSGLANALGIKKINGADYKTFMLYNSKLTVDQDVNLDNANDSYNKLEIASSNIINNKEIKGTRQEQTAIAQANGIAGNKAAITVINNGSINLNGADSTAIYVKNGVVENRNTGKINVLGKHSTGIYAQNNTEISNKGEIVVGRESTGIFYSDKTGNTSTGLKNEGKISLVGENAVAMIFEPGNVTSNVKFENNGETIGSVKESTGMYAKVSLNGVSYDTINSGTITLGDSTSLTVPNVAMYTNAKTVGTNPLENKGNITIGKNAIGIYGFEETNTGNITVGNAGVGMYSQGGDVNLNAGKIKTGSEEAVGVYSVGKNQTITNSGTAFDLGENSFGFVNSGEENKVISTIANNKLKNHSVYIYSNDTTGRVENSTKLVANGDRNYGIYSAGTVKNTADIDFGAGIGNVGIYSMKGGTAFNSAKITVGNSDIENNLYGIGMAAGYKKEDKGSVENLHDGEIIVKSENSIGMYASGKDSIVTNRGTITLNANRTTGIFLDNGAKGYNYGTIKTGVASLKNVVGVYVANGSILENHGSITIDAANAVGAYKKGGGIFKNYGTINITGVEAQKEFEYKVADTSKGIEGLEIDIKSGSPIVKRNGVAVKPVEINVNPSGVPKTVEASGIGMYMDTSGIRFTKPIENLQALTDKADIIVGTEITKNTVSKDIKITNPDIIKPYKDSMIANPQVTNWNIYSGSLTWMATAALDNSGYLGSSITMSKIPYTAFAGKAPTPVNPTDSYNFLDGLEQRYGIEKLGTQENDVFQKLNGIGKNEETLLHQAFDEMMGHQYANVQQRIQATGSILDQEFKYLKKEWDTKSKDSNKIKAFGMQGEYKTDTAGIIDYSSHAKGVAYLHEKETAQLGNTTGW
ncbi:hypothetical protein FUSO6_09845, partial [Fusobacterium necrophorum DAB]|uniref:autotransporter-associated N-terminal domain-containing protein n=1 Tax=Fusobacterium necrophorum TaxID=859 RepID=UPI000461B59C